MHLPVGWIDKYKFTTQPQLAIWLTFLLVGQLLLDYIEGIFHCNFLFVAQ